MYGKNVLSVLFLCISTKYCSRQCMHAIDVHERITNHEYAQKLYFFAVMGQSPETCLSLAYGCNFFMKERNSNFSSSV